MANRYSYAQEGENKAAFLSLVLASLLTPLLALQATPAVVELGQASGIPSPVVRISAIVLRIRIIRAAILLSRKYGADFFGFMLRKKTDKEKKA